MPPGPSTARPKPGTIGAVATTAPTTLGATFLLQYLKAPALVGAVAPSSDGLARAMSQRAHGFGTILELGAGTGAITRQLVADHPATPLLLFEHDARLARTLAHRFPARFVYSGCVHEQARAMLDVPADTVAVSSLPFRSLPASVRAPTQALIEDFLLASPNRRLVQFTYGRGVPFVTHRHALKWKLSQRVWRNVPPAAVWVLQQEQ